MNKNYILFCLLITFLFSCKDEQDDPATSLQLNKTSLEFSAAGETQSIQVTTNAAFDAVVESSAQSWCTTTIQGGTLNITVTRNETESQKKTTVQVVAGDKSEPVEVTQNYTPQGETRIAITGGSASSAETSSEDNKFENSFDGNFNTIWHTNWNEGNQYPYEITYDLEETDQLNYIIYYPRSGGGNGTFGSVEIQAKSGTSDSFVKIMDYDCGQKSTESKIMLTAPVMDPKSIRFIIKSGVGGHGSCAEMEFYRGSGEEVNVGTEIPLGGNSYISVAGSSGSVTDNGITNWSDPATVFSTFFRVEKAGNLELYLKYRSDADGNEIEVTCNSQVFPVTLPRPAGTYGLAYIGKLESVQTGYLRVDMKGVSRNGDVFAIPTALAVDGTASENMTYVKDEYYWGRRGPSVHMGYTLPSGKDCEWLYNEVTVPEGMDPQGSYFMSNGFNGGYFGMQVNSATERRVLFSVWSPYETDDPSSIPEEYRVIVTKKGEGVIVNDFGNEGSGGQSYLIYDWKAGTTYKFLNRIRPVDNGCSEFTAYFYAPEEGKWKLITQMLRPFTTTWYRGAHSFLENFNTGTGYLTRKALYNNQWVYTNDGEWIELTSGTFTTDSTGRSGARLDFKGGTEAGGFFLQNCGFFSDFVQPDTSFNRSNTNNPPEIQWDELD